MTDILAILASAGLWAAVLRIATPLILGTLGELLCERAGVLNLGIEGIMTFGAMIGWLAVFNGADLWTGLLVAALSGAAFGLVHALLTVTLGVSQHVSGLGITLFASSFAYYLFRLLVPVAGTPPKILPFQPLQIPVRILDIFWETDQHSFQNEKSLPASVSYRKYNRRHSD